MKLIQWLNSRRQRLSAIRTKDAGWTVPGVDYLAVLWESDGKESNRALGTIAFGNGRVLSVSKDWSAVNAEKASDIGDALFGVADSFVKTDQTSCILSTTTANEPGFEERGLKFQCGRRSMDIRVLREISRAFVHTSVSETIQ